MSEAKLLIFIIGEQMEQLNRAVDILQTQLPKLSLLGIVGTGDTEKACADSGLPFIAPQDLNVKDADYILLTGGKYNYENVVKTLHGEIDGNHILTDRLVCLPNFDLTKLQELRRSRLSIISINCAGGGLYHLFGMKFLSPFVNMFIDENDFLTMLEQEPREILSQQLQFAQTEFEPSLRITYPVYKLGDIKLHMNHYADFAVAEAKWYERRQRLNWYNTLILMYTEKEEILKRFDRLPFAKKVCFVPFPSDLPSAYALNRQDFLNEDMSNCVNHLASGRVYLYDLWDMLMYGKKTRVPLAKTPEFFRIHRQMELAAASA